jgi:hypothetical protein
MTITLYMPPGAGLFDSNGDPLSGGLVNTYVSGTTTAKATYPTQDDAAAQTNANANPVVLDSNGRAQIWLDGIYKIVVTDSAAVTIQTIDEYGLSTDSDAFDKQYKQGLEVTLDTDTDHDVNVTAGEARDGSDSVDIILSGEITKRIDAGWAVGDDQGGLDTGGVTTTSIYYIWLIQRSDTAVEDVLISLSASSPTMPSSYDKKVLVGVGKTDGSSNWTFVSKAGWQDAHDTIWPDSATSDAYALAPQPVYTQYFTGQRVRFRAATLNTAAATLNLNGLGAKALEFNGDALVTGDILANQIVEAEYDGTAFQMLTPPNILDVAQGGTGGASLTDGGVLLGSGTGAITAFGVLSDSNFLVGDGTTDPVAETGDTARISLGVGTSDSPTFTGLTTTGHTQRSLATGITAGTTQTMAGAAALTKDINIVTVNGNDDDGVALPTAVAGKEVTIINSDAAQRLQIWPGNGFSDTIDGGSANAVDPNKLAAGDVRTYVADGSTNWVTSAVNVSPASATVAGIVELATDAETITGTDTARAVTPANIQAKVAGLTVKGIVELATEDEHVTGTDEARASTVLGTASVVQDGKWTYVAGAGSADVQTLPLVPAVGAYVAGQRFQFLPTADNTGACTLNVSGLGAKNILKSDGAGALENPAAADLDTVLVADVIYDGTQFILQNPGVVSSGTVTVSGGGTGATSLTDGGVLLGSGTSAVTAMAVLADSEMIVGDGTADPVAESGATLRTSIGVGTGDTLTLNGLIYGHETISVYDEFTWTPTYTIESGSTTYTTRSGVGVQHGSVVTLSAYIKANSVSSPSGSLKLGGFPDTVPNVLGNEGSISFTSYIWDSGQTRSLTGHFIKNTTLAYVYKRSSGGVGDAAGDLADDAVLHFGASYLLNSAS